jgi:hypothetical protein
MEQTTNTNIKIVRLQSGEDIMADMIEDEENDTVMLDNPMHIIFKRIPTGQTVMMMMPWLPIELIKENNAILFTSDILTVIEPKDDLVEYYGNVVVEAQHRMEEQRKFTSLEEQYDEGEEEEYDEEEIDEDDLYDIMQQRKRSRIH